MIEYIQAKTIMSKSKSGYAWFGIDYTINLYRGCNFGCIYCDSRSDVYHNENFDKVKVKQDALTLLEKELKSKRHKGIISLGAMSDCYNDLEKDLHLTRDALKLINDYGFGVCLSTKSDLVLRDIDILNELSKNKGAIILVTITDYKQERASFLEPRASSVEERFNIIKTLNDNGIYCGILMMPLIPRVNDSVDNITNIVKLGKQAGAKCIVPSYGVTLRKGQQEYFASKLKEVYPNLYNEYYYANTYYKGSPNEKNLKVVFEGLCQRLDIDYKMKDIIEAYKTKEPEQLSLPL